MTTRFEASPATTGHVTPVLHAGQYILAWDDVSFEVDPVIGARVTALRLGGRNLLTGPDVDPGNFGSTFWTSPQSTWGWPPVPEIDHERYQVSIEDGAIVMRGGTSPTLGVDVEKRFTADRDRGAICFEFRLRNRGVGPVQAAPWQITRVPPGGLTFFPTGDGAFPPSNLAVREAGGVTWYDYDRAAVTGHQKLFADGREGWLAHVDGDALLLKTFSQVPRARQAPGEAQIEVYASPGHGYVEVEAQGAFDELAPGASSSWPVVWLVRRLPADLVRGAGSAALVDYVRRLHDSDQAAALAA